jgi:hypothetical protein
MTKASIDEESEAEAGEEEEESDDEFCDRTKAPVPKWEALATNKAVWTQLCQQLRLEQGSLGQIEREAVLAKHSSRQIEREAVLAKKSRKMNFLTHLLKKKVR